MAFMELNTLYYTSKGCTPIEVLPVPNAYTISQQTTGVFCFQNAIFALLTEIHAFDVNHKVSNIWSF